MVDIVFNSVDILESIFHIMTLPEVAGAAHINKMCNMVGKDVWMHKHIENDKKIAYWVKEARTIAQPFLDNKSHLTPAQYLTAQKHVYTCLSEIYDVDWSYFVHTEMDGWFEVLTRLDAHYLGAHNATYDHKNMSNRRKIMEKIKPLIYIDNTNKYSVYKLKQFAAWKGVPKAFKMKRSQLVKCLTRPDDEVYFYEDYNNK